MFQSMRLSRARVKLFKDRNAMLVKLLQEANKREDVLKRKVERRHGAYDNLNREHMFLKYEVLCSTCKRHRDETEAGDTIILCKGCSTGSLKLRLEKTREEPR